MTDQYPGQTPQHAPDAARQDAGTGGQPQSGVGPFTPRELIIVIVGALALLASFFSVYRFSFLPIWANGLEWILAALLPAAGTFLVLLRRLAPTAITRVGSLGIDQFASVAFSVGAVSWVGQLAWGVQGGEWYTTWVPWIETLLLLAGVFFTVVAPFVPPFREDFEGREERAAHPAARAPRPVVHAPKPQPAPAYSSGWPQQGQGYGQSGYGAYGQQPAYGAPQAGYDPQNPYASQQGPAPYGQPYPYGQQHAPQGATGAQPGYGYVVPGEEQAPSPQPADPSDEQAPAPVNPYLSVSPVAEGADPADPAPADAEQDEIADVDVTEPDAEQPAPEDAAHGGADELSRLVAQADASLPGEAPAAASQQPFWALVPVERDVVDETGAPLFRIGPTAWALVLEDRGEVFVVRDDDGRVGFLHDVSGVTRG
ncbi:hypothetical protein N8K70_10580 [Microbacterium betulae]|uniref:Uncharacterized protein n=1 Tax=Microbacterium betulae TaxID=2981139 RepID=A0AA97FG47_9MICO|nr:hypothetical protein [Microbacterium sp. AB]WOF21829.1 hypothetical protein N8K70_10580 [Microbacterium sp. AB]